MTDMLREIPPLPTAFVKSYDGPSTQLLRLSAPGHVTEAGLDGTSSRVTPSVWCTSFAVMTSRSWLWPTVAGGPATGARDSDAPSNFRMQRAALRAAAEPAR